MLVLYWPLHDGMHFQAPSKAFMYIQQQIKQNRIKNRLFGRPGKKLIRASQDYIPPFAFILAFSTWINISRL